MNLHLAFPRYTVFGQLALQKVQRSGPLAMIRFHVALPSNSFSFEVSVFENERNKPTQNRRNSWHGLVAVLLTSVATTIKHIFRCSCLIFMFFHVALKMCSSMFLRIGRNFGLAPVPTRRAATANTGEALQHRPTSFGPPIRSDLLQMQND